MSDENLERIGELMDEAWDLPHGVVKVRLIEEAVKLADVVRDLDAMFETRMELVDAGVFAGHCEKALPAFAWCLAQFEKEPDRFEYHQDTLLWYFKNILHNADELPQLTREQVEELREQMASLYRKCGFNMRPVHYTRLVFATRIGDTETAKESYASYHALPRDPMADCMACEADSDVEYFEFLGEWEKALKAAEPSLKGKQVCAEVPHRTYSYVLRPLALLGRYDQADEYQRKGYRMIRSNPVFLGHVALHMAYLLHRGDESSALRMLEQHLSWALESFHLRSRYMFYLSSKRTLSRVAENEGKKKLNLPQAFPVHNSTGSYDTAELVQWFDEELSTLGARFDARNGNQFFTQDLVERLQY